MNDPASLDEKQTAMIKRHLALVFKHEIDPSMGGPEHQTALNLLHNTPDHMTGVNTLVRC